MGTMNVRCTEEFPTEGTPEEYRWAYKFSVLSPSGIGITGTFLMYGADRGKYFPGEIYEMSISEENIV